MTVKRLVGTDPNQFSRNRDFGKLAWCDFQPLIGTGTPAPTVASATTIDILSPITFISGTTAIANINMPPMFVGGGQITLIPTGIFTTVNTGNIALATTAVVSKALIMTYDTTTGKFYPSY